MVPRRSARAVLVCLVLVIPLVAALAPVAGAPPPRPLCGACGDSFESTAAAGGVDVTVQRSSATISVHGNGSATWVVRNHLADADDDAVERLRANESMLDEVADRAMRRDVTLLEANISPEGVLTARYRDAHFAERSVGGTLRSGAFTAEYGYANLDGLGADRLDVVAPAGMSVGRSVPGATVSDDARRMTLTRLDDGAIVTFVSRDSSIGPLVSVLAVGSMIAPAVVRNTVTFVVVPSALFGLVVGGIAWSHSKVQWDLGRVRDGAGRGLVGVGTLVCIGSVLAVGGESLFSGSAGPSFGVGIALIAIGVVISRLVDRDRTGFRTLVASSLIGLLVAVGATVAGAIVVEPNGLTRSLVSGLPYLVPLFALLPAGYAAGRGDRGSAAGIAAFGFAAAMAMVTPFTSPSVGLGIFLAVVAIVYAVVVTLLGLPLLVVGMSLATGRSSD